MEIRKILSFVRKIFFKLKNLLQNVSKCIAISCLDRKIPQNFRLRRANWIFFHFYERFRRVRFFSYISAMNLRSAQKHHEICLVLVLTPDREPNGSLMPENHPPRASFQISINGQPFLKRWPFLGDFPGSQRNDDLFLGDFRGSRRNDDLFFRRFSRISEFDNFNFFSRLRRPGKIGPETRFYKGNNSF